MVIQRGGLLVVVSAPSGAGKTTLCERLLREMPDAVYSVSCTTRAPRGDEQDGREYHFLSGDAFDQRLAAGAFIEHAVVHGERYGTLRDTLVEALHAGRIVLMDIDVQGAAQIRAQVDRSDCPGILKTAFVDVFVAPPSLDVLRERLVKRGEDRPDVVERRIANAAMELAQEGEFMHRVVNDDIDAAYTEFKAIILAARSGSQRA